MNRFFKTTDRFLTLQRILNDYPEAFEGFTKIINARDTFAGNNERMSELLSVLDRPYTEYHALKRDAASKLHSAVDNAIGTAISVASELHDNVMQQTMKNYRSSLWHYSYHSLSEIALRVVDTLNANLETALLTGMTNDQFAELQQLSSVFREIMQSTSYEMSSRKAAHNELRLLALANRKLLTDYLDSFVKSRKAVFPAFYNAYMTERNRKNRRKRSVNSESALCEITGTVTDSAKGLPLANAVINLASPETIVYSDDDGVYVLEELEAGDYTVSCHLTGYDIPTDVTVTAAAGDSLVVDFALTPAQQQQAAA
jgi:hypothetical protein